MKLAYGLGIALAAFCLAAPTAEAGQLGKVVKGVRDKKRSSSASRSSSKPDRPTRTRERTRRSDRGHRTDRPRHRRRSVSHWRPRRRVVVVQSAPPPVAACVGCAPGTAAVAATATAEPRPPLTPRLDLYLGGQSVIDSDYSGTARVRGRLGWFGLEVANTTFVEASEKESSGDTLTLHAWNAGALIHLGSSEPAPGHMELILTGGAAGISTTGVELTGLHLGADVRLHLNTSTSLFAEVDRMFYEDDIDGLDVRVGLGFGPLRVAYRNFDLNTGPPLQGPEVGFEFRF